MNNRCQTSDGEKARGWKEIRENRDESNWEHAFQEYSDTFGVVWIKPSTLQLRLIVTN